MDPRGETLSVLAPRLSPELLAKTRMRAVCRVTFFRKWGRGPHLIQAEDASLQGHGHAIAESGLRPC